jgi:hypothetical protein
MAAPCGVYKMAECPESRSTIMRRRFTTGCALAQARMLGQRGAHADPTGLANEAIPRLLKCDPAHVNDEEHFMMLAAEAMRQIWWITRWRPSSVAAGRSHCRWDDGHGTTTRRVTRPTLRMDPGQILI